MFVFENGSLVWRPRASFELTARSGAAGPEEDGGGGGGDDQLENGGGDDEVDETEETEVEEDGGDDVEAAEAAEDGAEEVAPRRQESRYQRNERLRREAQAESQGLKERLARLEAAQSQPRQPPFDPEAARRQEQQFIESLQLMDPTSAAIAVRDRERQLFGHAFQQLRGETLDRQDKSDFRTAARDDPAIRRLSGRVEEAIGEARRLGNFNLTRMDVFYRIYGEEMAGRRTSQRPGQQRQAQRRVNGQSVRATSGRGQAPREQRQPADADEALLRQITVGDL